PQFQLIAYSLSSTTASAPATTTANVGAPTVASSTTRTSAPAAANATATTVQVKGGEFFFRLSTKSAAKLGTVTFVFRNVGHVLHDFQINGKHTPLTQPGKTAKLAVTFKKKGTYPYLCTVPGHAQAGM